MSTDTNLRGCFRGFEVTVTSADSPVQRRTWTFGLIYVIETCVLLHLNSVGLAIQDSSMPTCTDAQTPSAPSCKEMERTNSPAEVSNPQQLVHCSSSGRIAAGAIRVKPTVWCCGDDECVRSGSYCRIRGWSWQCTARRCRRKRGGRSAVWKTPRIVSFTLPGFGSRLSGVSWWKSVAVQVAN